MNRLFFKTIKAQALMLAAGLALSGAVMVAQDAAPAQGQRSDGQI